MNIYLPQPACNHLYYYISFAVGSDGKVNMWSIRTGELLQSINRTMSNGLPHIAFSEHLGGGSGEPSLLVTDGDDLVTYTVK